MYICCFLVWRPIVTWLCVWIFIVCVSPANWTHVSRTRRTSFCVVLGQIELPNHCPAHHMRVYRYSSCFAATRKKDDTEQHNMQKLGRKHENVSSFISHPATQGFLPILPGLDVYQFPGEMPKHIFIKFDKNQWQSINDNTDRAGAIDHGFGLLTSFMQRIVSPRHINSSNVSNKSQYLSRKACLLNW